MQHRAPLPTSYYIKKHAKPIIRMIADAVAMTAFVGGMAGIYYISKFI